MLRPRRVGMGLSPSRQSSIAPVGGKNKDNWGPETLQGQVGHYFEALSIAVGEAIQAYTCIRLHRQRAR